MGIFGKKGITDSEPDKTGKVKVIIEVKRLEKSKRETTLKILDYDKGAIVYKATFESENGDFAAHNLADDDAKYWTRNHGYIIDETYSDADLPKVTTSDKRMR